MIKVEINEKDCELNIKNIVSKSTGEVLTFKEQKAYIYNGGIYPQGFMVQIDKDELPYPAGFYTIDVASYSVGDFGSLNLKKLKLIPYPLNQK